MYFSSASGNTHRFIERLGATAHRIASKRSEPTPLVQEPYILVLPTYSDGYGRGAVAKQVIGFLNDAQQRELIRGVIASGNRNFGRYFAYAGDVVSQKCKVPLLYRFELAGTATDITRVENGIENFWKWNS